MMAMAAPMPLAPPVTRAILPDSAMWSGGNCESGLVYKRELDLVMSLELRSLAENLLRRLVPALEDVPATLDGGDEIHSLTLVSWSRGCWCECW